MFIIQPCLGKAILLSDNNGTEVAAKDAANTNPDSGATGKETAKAQNTLPPKPEAKAVQPTAAPAKPATTATAAPAAPLSKEDQQKKLIEEERQRRFNLIRDVKAARNRLSYKIADKAAISQLSEISKSNTKNIGFLRRKKEQIEFRIATEAFTLEAEKDLIRKKAAIDEELEHALKSFRLRKKLEFINKDIEELTKRMADSELKIKESDKKLDELYGALRAMTGEARRRQRPEMRKPREQQKPQEVSLADIAVIKEKKEDRDSESSFDESVLN